MKSFIGVAAAAVLALFGLSAGAQTFSGGIPAGWSGVGGYGTLGADGVVTLAPGGGTAYGYVTTAGGVGGASPFSFGSETNASWLRSSAFSANAGDSLDFKFNYVSSDGAGFADYAWSRVLNASDLSQVALLFTARTNQSGVTIPGFGMPAPDATISPSPLFIVPGGPVWSPLGGYSGACYNTGCGYTGWVSSSYTIAAAGSYILEFGAANWIDTIWDTGLAFDGLTIAGNPIPEPGSLVLLSLALLGLGGLARRRAA